MDKVNNRTKKCQTFTLLASTGVEAKAGLAGVAVPELAAPFFCLLGCLALMSDMIEAKKIRSASFELHWTNIVLNVLSHGLADIYKEETKKTEQNTLKIVKNRQSLPFVKLKQEL